LNITKNIKIIALDVFINKSRATEKWSQLFDNDFGECVNENYSSKGRVGITGIGKNAIIANKIMAPLNPTVHISESNNSLGIKALVPLLKRKASKLVVRARNTNSLQEQKTVYKLNKVSLKSHFNYQILATSLNLGYGFIYFNLGILAAQLNMGCRWYHELHVMTIFKED
jgi:D-arabinose 5-phosphate isomerase GutQ